MNGLEALERLMSKYNEMCLDTGCNDDEYQNGNTTSERAIIEQELKALEIIKDKRVNVERFEIILHDYKYFSLEEQAKTYNSQCARWNVLSRDEFDLLKEVLG